MRYGQVAGNKKIDAAIHYCLQYIDEDDARKFVRKFHKQPHDKIQVMHTFRELILGAFLASNRLRVKSEYKIDLKTPDWCLMDVDSQPQCLIELVNFHAAAETEAEIGQQIREKGLWCDWVKPNTDRLYTVLWKKVETYRVLANSHSLPYVIAIFSEFTANVEQDELDECLCGVETGLFSLYPELSGTLFFEESWGSYMFTYHSNPHAERAIALPEGCFRTRNA